MWTHPSSFDELTPEVFLGVLKGQLLTADMIDRRCLLQMQEEIILKADHTRILLVLEVDFNGQKEAAIARLRHRVWRLLDHYKQSTIIFLKQNSYNTHCTVRWVLSQEQVK